MALRGRSAGNRSRQRGEENEIDKYMIGGEEVWKKGFGKIMEMIEELKGEMKGELEKWKEEVGRMNEQLMIERREREEERRKEKEEWIRERRILEERIKNLEWINEKKDKGERRNRIVIRGVKWRKEKLEQEIVEFIRNKLKVNIGIKKAYMMGQREDRSITIAELDSWEQKRSVMSRKKDLEKGIIIEDDLTKREREIQKNLREVARREREKGAKYIKIGYKKIKIEEKWYKWNEKEERLVEEGGGE